MSGEQLIRVVVEPSPAFAGLVEQARAGFEKVLSGPLAALAHLQQDSGVGERQGAQGESVHQSRSALSPACSSLNLPVAETSPAFFDEASDVRMSIIEARSWAAQRGLCNGLGAPLNMRSVNTKRRELGLPKIVLEETP